VFDYAPWLRESMLPHIWCAGCGDGIVLKAMLRALGSLQLDRDRIALVSGIGCSSRLPGYVDADTLHTTHGRPLAFATGLKLARPELTVLVITGDGDALAIGGNHFIHAARRNLDLTAILFNNRIYGMTGGQASPSTPPGSRATTAPHRSIEPAFDPCRLAIGAGATYVARGTVFHAQQLTRLIADAIAHPGFALVEVLTTCPVYYGRFNKLGATDLIAMLKDGTVNAKMAERLPPEHRAGKILTGLLHRETRPEYGAESRRLIAAAGGLPPAGGERQAAQGKRREEQGPGEVGAAVAEAEGNGG
jgi:2-oxoglutarate ferredoxin oxidoreductase subunit beta